MNNKTGTAFLLVLAILIIQSCAVSAIQVSKHNFTAPNVINQPYSYGALIVPVEHNITLYSVNKSSSANGATNCKLYYGNETNSTFFIANGTFVGNRCSFNTPMNLTKGQSYIFLIGAEGASYDVTYAVGTIINGTFNRVFWETPYWDYFNTQQIVQQVGSQNVNTLSLEYENTCVETWTPTYGLCQLNDTRLKTYVDTNNCGSTDELPVDNGTMVACNYCSQNLTPVLGTCQETGNQSVSYNDTNYLSCCIQTGLVSDCSILFSPYNETSEQSCDFYTNDFNCTIDTEPVLNSKINVVCEMPSNESYNCLVNTYQDDALLATSPEYKEASNSLISLSSESETRTSFSPQNSLLNAYYTTKELRPDTLYRLQVQCAGASGVVKSEYPITPEYKTPDAPLHRLVWARQNAGYLIGGILIVLVVVGLFGYLRSKL